MLRRSGGNWSLNPLMTSQELIQLSHPITSAGWLDSRFLKKKITLPWTCMLEFLLWNNVKFLKYITLSAKCIVMTTDIWRRENQNVSVNAPQIQWRELIPQPFRDKSSALPNKPHRHRSYGCPVHYQRHFTTFLLLTHSWHSSLSVL